MAQGRGQRAAAAFCKSFTMAASRRCVSNRGDETFIGRLQGQSKARNGWGQKDIVLTLVERGDSARLFHIVSTTAADIFPHRSRQRESRKSVHDR